MHVRCQNVVQRMEVILIFYNHYLCKNWNIGNWYHCGRAHFGSRRSMCRHVLFIHWLLGGSTTPYVCVYGFMSSQCVYAASRLISESLSTAAQLDRMARYARCVGLGGCNGVYCVGLGLRVCRVRGMYWCWGLWCVRLGCAVLWWRLTACRVCLVKVCTV